MANPQPTVSFVAQLNQLFIVDPTQSGVVVAVVALNGFQGLGGTKSAIKLSNLDSNGYDEYAPGLVDPGKPSGSVILNYGDTSHQLCQKLLGMGSSGNTQFFYAQSDGAGGAALPTAPSNVMTPPKGTLVAAPGTVTPSTSTTGGLLPAATYYYKLTALNVAGETTPSAEASQVTTGATSKNTLTWGSVAGATGYNLYRSTTTGAETYLTTLGAVLSFVDDGSIVQTSTVVPPAANTTNGYSRSGWLFNGFVAEFAFQTQTNNVAMCKLTVQATGSRGMIVRGSAAPI